MPKGKTKRVFPERLDALGLSYGESYARAVKMLECPAK